MGSRLVRIAVVAAVTSLLAACGSLGGARPGGAVAGLPGGGAVRAGEASPAPFVAGTMRRYQVRGRWYQPAEQPDYDQTGLASWYGPGFNGRPTASGERFDQDALTAAHKTLPLPALVEVTNLANGRQVVLRVNDRGPFVDDRIIDLSRGAAQELGLLGAGVGEVRVRYVGRAPALGGGRPLERAEARPEPRRTPDRRSDYWVQAAAYSDPVMAQRLAERLGDQAQVHRAEVNGQTFFRVRVGPWGDINAAERSRQAVIARGIPDALLISAD